MRRILYLIILISLCLIWQKPLSAQEMSGSKMSLTLTPPLIKGNLLPGQSWRGSIKLSNPGNEALRIYLEARDFRAADETGLPEYIEVGDNASPDAFLSKWINFSEPELVLEPSQSRLAEFTVSVPENAAPGGHYAAILAGTKAPQRQESGSSIKVSSQVSSLLLMNVQGEVIEDGRLAEFGATNRRLSEAEVKFRLRFENKGNVHLQPQGGVTVYDMYGRLQTTIPINQHSQFGNVLPKQAREWVFPWTAGPDPLSMGRYRAVLTLSYGEKSVENADQTIYFWVIYWHYLLPALFTLILLVILPIILAKAYVRRALRQVPGFSSPEFQAKESKKRSIADFHKLILSLAGIMLLLSVLILLFFFLS